MAKRIDRDGEEYLEIRTKDQRGALLHRAYNVNDLKELAGIVLGDTRSELTGLGEDAMKAMIREVLQEVTQPSAEYLNALSGLEAAIKRIDDQLAKEKKDAKPKQGKPKPGSVQTGSSQT